MAVRRRGNTLEYLGTGNREPLLVGLDDEGEFADECPTQELGSILTEHEQNAISVDGETVFFTDKCRGGLFARVDNGLTGAHTISISEPTKADCATCDTEEAVRQPATFLGASEDGSHVYFETTQPLLGGETGVNVYEYDANAPEGERVVKVTGGDGTVANPEPGFQGAVQISPDGSHIYFVATGVLTTTKSYAGKEAQSGGDNLYLFERNAQYPDGRIVFIATLPFQDRILWGAYRGEQGYVCGSVSELPTEDSDITPDGRFLVFLSHVLLTPGDVSSAGQVFEYDAQQNAMVRVSVGQNGYNKNGNVSLAPSARFDSTFCDPEDPHIGYASYQQAVYESAAYTRSLTVSADGSYVFFESPDALTPQALNFAQIGVGHEGEPIYAKNVYEYHEGNVYLISDGQDISLAKSESTSRFEGTDLSGRDVFLATSDRAGAAGHRQQRRYLRRSDRRWLPVPAAPGRMHCGRMSGRAWLRSGAALAGERVPAGRGKRFEWNAGGELGQRRSQEAEGNQEEEEEAEGWAEGRPVASR